MTTGAQIVVATTTQYDQKDHVRAGLALRTFQRLSDLGYPMFVVDSNSDPEWRRQFQTVSGLKLINEGPDPRTDMYSMGAGRRQAVTAASLVCAPDGAVVWMEPEKLSFADWIVTAATPVLHGLADLVVPKRQSLHTYPKEQIPAEELGNMAVANLLGAEFDFWFGPRVWSLRALPHMIEYADKGTRDYGDKWDSIMIPCLRAMAAGLRVMSVEVGYHHPEEQKAQEQGVIDFTVRRITQLYNIVPALKTEVGHLGITGKYAGVRV